jgi:hypothetical protein
MQVYRSETCKSLDETRNTSQKRKKMSQEINLREDSHDKGEWPNTASIPSLPLSRNRPRRDEVGNEDAQVAEHRESHECIAAAGSQPMNSDSEQTSQNDGSANKHSQKPSTSKPPSNSSRRQWRGASAWKDRLTELAHYRKIHGHCNVPQRYSKNPKLGAWVGTQRKQYKLRLEGKKSAMTLSHIQQLESLNFEWNCSGATWEERLSELANYRKIHGHCNVPMAYRYSQKSELATWVGTQRNNYKLHLKGNLSCMTPFRIQKLESLDFVWDSHSAARQERLSELADYRKIHGNCNVPRNYSENTKLATWVGTQRNNYKLHLKGEKSHLTLLHIQELKSLGFEWDTDVATWEGRLRELADYRKIHGHCNVPAKYGENAKLANWVTNQRSHYRLHVKGKTSQMTRPRIQALESLSFEWKPSISGRKRISKKSNLDGDARRAHKEPANSKRGADSRLETAPCNEMFRATGYH